MDIVAGVKPKSRHTGQTRDVDIHYSSAVWPQSVIRSCGQWKSVRGKYGGKMEGGVGLSLGVRDVEEARDGWDGQHIPFVMQVSSVHYPPLVKRNIICSNLLLLSVKVPVTHSRYYLHHVVYNYNYYHNYI